MNVKKLQPGFGDRLKKERKRLGLSQAEFAEKVGLKRITQHFYEKGHSHPNYQYFLKISDFGVDLGYLFFDKKADSQGLELSLNTLKQIFTAVDERCRDKSGNLLPVEQRLEFFSLLCVSISGRDEQSFDLDSMANLLAK